MLFSIFIILYLYKIIVFTIRKSLNPLNKDFLQY